MEPSTSTTDARSSVPAVAGGKYRMQISRLTIDKLGIQLYDRVSAVLAELIANCYDADATQVTVTLPWGKFLADKSGRQLSEDVCIVVEDDGHGMSASEVNSCYLTVGSDRRRRTGSDLSREKERPVMGRKGIGKLAPFGICRTIEVITAGSSPGDRPAEGWPISHVILRLGQMLNDTEETYFPEVGPLDETIQARRGTRIILRDFARKRVPTRAELDRQLAARFGLQRADWSVSIQDSDDPSAVFTLGSLNVDILPDTRIDLGGRHVDYDGRTLPVSGWVAYSKQPYKDDAMAGVRIFARGKLVAQTRDFGIGAGFTGEYKLRSYLVGELHAEWLDEGEDLVRSDRQDIIWSSDLGEAFSKWGQELIRELAKRGEVSVQKRVWDEFLERSNLEDELKERAPGDAHLRDSIRAAAKILVSNKDRAALSDPKHVEQVKQLAYSLGPQRTLIEMLRTAAEGAETTLDAVVRLFDQASIAEVYSLGQVARERIAVVNKLEELVSDHSTLEDKFQSLIETAPWLLAPEWTPLGMNQSLQRVRTQFEQWYEQKNGEELCTSAIANPRREPDFVLLHDAGTLWIVEIKRMNHHLTDPEYSRAVDYLDVLTKFLGENPRIGSEFPHQRLTFVVDHIDRLGGIARSSLESDKRIDRKTWNELLSDTKRVHQDFLTRVDQLRLGGCLLDNGMD